MTDKRFGSKFWMARAKHGRDKIFQTPEILWESVLEYFEWVEANPLWEAKAFPYQGEVTIEYLPKMRAMTIIGLCLFLDITYETWMNYRARKDFFRVIAQAEDHIRDQKFTGAAADLLNANIIARELGLSDKQETRHTIELTPEQRDAKIEELKSKLLNDNG